VHKLLKQAAVYGLSHGLNHTIGLLLVPIYARVFTKELFGAIDLITVTASVLLLILSLGLDSALSRFYYEDTNIAERKRLVSTAVWFVLGLSTLACLVLLPLVGPISVAVVGSTTFATPLLLTVARVPAQLFVTLALMILRLAEQPWTFLRVSACNLLLTVLLSIWFVVYLQWGLIGVFAAQLVATTAVAVWAGVMVRGHLGWAWQPRRLRPLLLYGVPLVPAMLSTWLVQYAGRLTVPQFIGLAELAEYAVAARISSVLLLACSAFNLAWGPFAMSTLHQADAPRTYARIFHYYLVAAAAGGGLLTVFAAELVEIFAGRPYAGAARLVGMLTGGVIIYQAWNMLNLGVSIARRTYFNTVTVGLGGLITVAANLVLVPRLGTSGAALATLAGYATGAAAIYVVSQRYYRIAYDLSGLFRVGAGYVALATLAGWGLQLELSWTGFWARCVLLGAFLAYLVAFTLSRHDRRRALEGLARPAAFVIRPRRGPGGEDGLGAPDLTKSGRAGSGR
jgi:O-antigen/teichoic acid export membrane protein